MNTANRPLPVLVVEDDPDLREAVRDTLEVAHQEVVAVDSGPAALAGSLLIRAHGIWLWARRLPVRPRPVHPPQEGV